MNRVKSAVAVACDFVVGDDWHAAVLVVVGLAATALLTRVAGVNAWWLLPILACAALAWSLHRATRPKP